MKAVKPVPKPVTLAAMKVEPRLEGLALIRQSRLSVVPVSAEHWAVISAMAGL
jgi:predicted RNA-binding protein with PUA-like domain